MGNSMHKQLHIFVYIHHVILLRWDDFALTAFSVFFLSVSKAQFIFIKHFVPISFTVSELQLCYYTSLTPQGAEN